MFLICEKKNKKNNYIYDDIDVLQEEEMRRLVAAQRDLHGGETSQSDWSEEEEEDDDRGVETDEGGLDQLSMAANGCLTDAEGAMSDINSIYDCGDVGDGHEMDDTSLSSRASSRIFDSDQIYSDGRMYDSEYDNYRGHMTSDAESDFPNEDLDSDVGAVLDELSMENIRQISKNITRKFGARSDREDEDSDAVV